MDASDQPNRRAHRRFRVLPMYATVMARRLTETGTHRLHGHVYDVSEGGVRIELDEPLELGESIAVRLGLPGAPWEHGGEASASVVWVNDAEDDPGPRRMALRFVEFPDRSDRDRLVSYLASGTARQAA